MYGFRTIESCGGGADGCSCYAGSEIRRSPSEGPTVGKALGVAIVNGHMEMVEFLFQRCPSTEMVPAVEAAADRDLRLLERILAKCGFNMELSSRGKKSFCLCFRSAASRGSEEIVKLLVGTLLSPWGFSIQNAICTVLEDAASHSKYDMLKGILNAVKARQLCYPSTFASPVFKKARESNDREMVELLIKYSEEGMVDLGRVVYLERLKKTQRLY